MRLPVEILHHIFSSLVSHQETLVACSQDPVLLPIVERHLYYHVNVFIGRRRSRSISDYALKPDLLSKRLSENPRILHYVRILQIDIAFDCLSEMGQLRKFAKTLLMFPLLECIMLRTFSGLQWSCPDFFRAALEDRLNLPTVRELHLTGSRDGDVSSLFEICKNIKSLSLLGTFEVYCLGVSTLPQLKSLDLSAYFISDPLRTWLKPHITELQSLKCASFGVGELPQLFEVCKGTLTTLEVDLTNTECKVHVSSDSHDANAETLDSIRYQIMNGDKEIADLPEIPSVPPNLQYLTIHSRVSLSYDNEENPVCGVSYLPAAAEIINLFITSKSLQHLVLDIDIDIIALSDFDKLYLSPLDELGTASASIERIDLYVRTGLTPPHDQLLSLLEDFTSIAEWNKRGILVIHLEESAPDWV